MTRIVKLYIMLATAFTCTADCIIHLHVPLFTSQFSGHVCILRSRFSESSELSDPGQFAQQFIRYGDYSYFINYVTDQCDSLLIDDRKILWYKFFYSASTDRLLLQIKQVSKCYIVFI